MWGWETPPRRNFDDLLPHSCCLVIGRAARVTQLSSVAIGILARLPEDASIGDLRRLHSGCTAMVMGFRISSTRRQPGFPRRPGSTSRTWAWWAMGSGSPMRMGAAASTIRVRNGFTVHQLEGNSRCLGAQAGSPWVRLLPQGRTLSLLGCDVARRLAAGMPSGTPTPMS